MAQINLVRIGSLAAARRMAQRHGNRNTINFEQDVRRTNYRYPRLQRPFAFPFEFPTAFV